MIHPPGHYTTGPETLLGSEQSVTKDVCDVPRFAAQILHTIRLTAASVELHPTDARANRINCLIYVIYADERSCVCLSASVNLRRRCRVAQRTSKVLSTSESVENRGGIFCLFSTSSHINY